MFVSSVQATSCDEAVDNVATRSYIGNMKRVGVRELKNRLSEYLREVRAGERLLVTDRGEVIAELAPPGQGGRETDVPAALLVLARRGWATLGAAGNAAVYPSLPRRGRRKLTAAQLLDDERGSR
jgi:antitoxin (DNA-binding transcriptional repressor) of toxin-antitoxin stability system